MSLKKSALILLLGLCIPKSVLAVVEPSFPACTAPQGSVKASYSDGTHGIAGSTSEYTGSDTVYTLSDSTVTQCYCDKSGHGIQTNWWKANQFSQDDIKILKNSGWVFIPNGSLWGLDPVAYVAKNNDFTCNGGIGGGEVQSSSTSVGSVLGLASTGDSILISFFTVLGFTALMLSWLLKCKTSK